MGPAVDCSDPRYLLVTLLTQMKYLMGAEVDSGEGKKGKKVHLFVRAIMATASALRARGLQT